MQQDQWEQRELGQTTALFWIWGIGPVAASWFLEAEEELDPLIRHRAQEIEPEFDPDAGNAWIKRWIGSEAQVYHLIAGCRPVINAAHFAPERPPGQS